MSDRHASGDQPGPAAAPPPSAPSSSSSSPSAVWFPLPCGLGDFVRVSLSTGHGRGVLAAAAPPDTVFVVDISGSMGGAPIRQVNTILKHLSGVCSARKLADPRVITYDVAAVEMSLSAYLAAPPECDRGTHFSCAYRAMTAYIQGYAARRREMKSGQQTGACGISFIFMSDGDALANDFPAMALTSAALKSAIADLAPLNVPVTVHVIGLGSDVKAALLTDVSRFGNIEGSFRYSIEAQGLGEKFVDLFEFGLAATPCKLRIAGDRAHALGSHSSSSSASGNSDAAGVRVLDCQARIEDVETRTRDCAADRTTRRAETLAKLAAAANGGPVVSAQVAPAAEMDNAAQMPSGPTQAYIIECLLPCDGSALSAGTVVSVTLAGSDRAVELVLGEPEAAPTPLLLLSAFEMVEPSNASQTADLMKIVGSMHTRGRSMTERLSIESQRQTLLSRLTACMELLNAAAFQGAHGSEVSALRLKDLRSEHKFAKSRRARVMALRENDNSKHMAAIEGRLDTAHSRLSPMELAQLDAMAAAGDWNCMLSLDSVADLMRGSTDDFLCIGLLVEREESVVDSPQTGLRLLSVSSSLVSFNSFVDAMSSAVAEKGFSAVHGAFKHSKRGQLADVNGANRVDIAGAAAEAHADQQDDDGNAGAYAFVGQAREKINCVFPLSLGAAHNHRVSLLKRVWLSHLFTLDALAYDKQQEIGAVALLAQMVSNFNGTERQALILREVASVVSNMLTHSPSAVAAFPPERFSAFVHTIEGKARQHVPNLGTPLVMAWLGDDFGATLKAKQPAGAPGGAPLDLAAAAASASSSSSSAESPAPTAELTLSDDLLCAVYLAYTQRLVRDGYAALAVDAHKIAARLLYGDPKPASADSSASSSAAPVQAPFHVRQAAALAEFASWFYDPSEPVPSLPVADAADMRASAPSQSIACTEDVAAIVDSLLPPMPAFLQRLLGGIDQLRTKWQAANKERAARGHEAAASIMTSASAAAAAAAAASSSVLSRCLGCLPYAASLDSCRVEYFRRHLLSFYFYHNDVPPASCTLDSVSSQCHARFVARATEKQASAASLEQHNALATLLSTADDLSAFGGLARFYCPTRNGPVFRLMVAQLVHRADKEKLSALLRNEINGITLYDAPQLAQSVWIPAGLGLVTQIRALVGHATLAQIAAEHRAAGHTCTHLYRPSDLPNRQGHCNSHPWPHHKRPFAEYQ